MDPTDCVRASGRLAAGFGTFGTAAIGGAVLSLRPARDEGRELGREAAVTAISG